MPFFFFFSKMSRSWSVVNKIFSLLNHYCSPFCLVFCFVFCFIVFLNLFTVITNVKMTSTGDLIQINDINYINPFYWIINTTNRCNSISVWCYIIIISSYLILNLCGYVLIWYFLFFWYIMTIFNFFICLWNVKSLYTLYHRVCCVITAIKYFMDV